MSTYSYSYPSAPGSPDEQVTAAEPTTVHYAPRRPFWESRGVRTGALFTALAVCGVVILAVLRKHIGTEPFLVGMALAVLPVPLLVTAFLWLDRVAPTPWQNVVFAFCWGACAATLVALFANEYGTKLLVTTFSGTDTQSDQWGATFVAPLVEETAKGTAILLLFLFRRRHFESVLDGIVVSGLVATGFAFTENVLYLGTAFSEDKALGSATLGSTTVATFIVRGLMTPFAHPLFTSMTGIGFALAATVRPGRRWRRRWTLPLAGWLLAMTLHGTWNGSSRSPIVFLTVYVSVMIPVFGLVLWLAFWARSAQLRTIRTHLPAYARAGWIGVAEPYALGSMKVRAEARREARRFHGEAAARAVRDYIAFATHLAFLRGAATKGAPEPDFAAREAELLGNLWHRKEWARPALAAAGQVEEGWGPVPVWGVPGPWGAAGSWGAPQPWGARGPWGAPPPVRGAPGWGPGGVPAQRPVPYGPAPTWTAQGPKHL